MTGRLMVAGVLLGALIGMCGIIVVAYFSGPTR